MAKKVSPEPRDLKSWKAIAEYLHMPLSTVHRWAHEGMPVRRQGRYVVASPAELAQWLGSGKPVHVTEPGDDLTSDLRKAVESARELKRRAS